MRVSVVVATYQSARFLGEQLASILTQSRPVDEIIISDDASTDDTRAIAQASLNGVPQVRWLSDGRRRGVVGNVERGLLAAQGDLILLSDHDDRWRSDKVAVAVDWFEHNPATLAWFSDAGLIDGAGRPLQGSLWARVGFDETSRERWNGGAAMASLVRGTVVTGATLAIHRSLLEHALPFPEAGLHDEWLALVAASLGTVRAEPLQLIDYRLHGANAVGLGAVGWRGRWQAGPHGFDAVWAELNLVESLRERLSGRAVVPAAEGLIDGRIEHLRKRLTLPEARPRRLLPILRDLPGGGYGRFSTGTSAVVWDAIRKDGPRSSGHARLAHHG